MAGMGKGDSDLMKLYKERLHDVQQLRSRRQKQNARLPPHFKQVLQDYFKSEPDALRKIDEQRALMAWPQFVGESVGRVSRALRFQAGTLVIGVTDPLWLQQLLFLKHDLLERYQREFPSLKIKDIFMKRESVRK